MKKIMEGLVVLAVIGLVLFIVGASLKSAHDKDQQSGDCDAKCGIHKSFVIFNKCHCQTDKGWQQWEQTTPE